MLPVMAPHVLMCLTTPLPFGASWARAAALVASVTTVSRVRRSKFPAVPGVAFLHRSADNPREFELVGSPLRYLRPRRFASIAEGIHFDHRFQRAFDWISRQIAPIDVVHSHFAGIWDLARVTRKVRVPLIHTEHATAFLPEQPIVEKRITRAGLARARRLFAQASTVIAVSEHLRQAILARGLAGNFSVLPNPIDTRHFSAREMPPHDDAIRWLSIGRLAPEKNPRLLLRAFASAVGKDPRLSLELIGGGVELPALRAMVIDLGLRDKVTFKGFVAQQHLPESLAAAHAFVTATQLETFGVAIAEALSCGRPVVAPAVGPVPDLISSESGLLVRPNDVEALTSALLEVASNLGRWSPTAIATAARRRWSDERVAEGLGPIYARATQS